jgi:glycosyltransferase involved in cell wall biosynthesis
MTGRATGRDGRPLRVHLVGNTCNNHYLIAKGLRRLGVDAHLFHDAGLHWQTHPVADDPHLETDAPDWLHPYRAGDVGPVPFRRAGPVLAARLADCDLVHAEDVGLVWAAQTGRPYVWDPYGYDVNFYGFPAHWRPQWHAAHPDRVLAALAFRQAVAGCDAIQLGLWYEPLAHGFAMIDRLVAPGTFGHRFALAIDTERFAPGPAPDLATLLARAGSPVVPRGLTIFHPVRVMFTAASYVNKANDRLIRAVGALHAEGRDVTLVLVERGGPCEVEARALIAELGITARVAWIPAMPKHELLDWYRAADVAADEFIGGAMGSVAFEALATGTPLLSYLRMDPQGDPTFWSPAIAMPELPPMLNASTTDEIAAVLRPYTTDRAALAALGAASRDWAVRNVSHVSVAERWLEVYHEVLARRAGGARPAGGIGRPLPGAPLATATLLARLDEGTGSPADRLFALLDEHPGDARLVQALVDLLERSGQASLAREVRAHAGELLPWAFAAPAPAPVAPDFATLPADALVRTLEQSLAGGATGTALAALDALRARTPGAPHLDDARRRIVGSQHLAVRPHPVAPAPAPLPAASATPVRVAGRARPRILAIADVPRWIFERHVHTLRDRLADEFEIVPHYHESPFDEDAYDLVYALEYGLVPTAAIRSPWKYVTALRSHVSWERHAPSALAAYLQRHFQRTHVVSRRLRDAIAPWLPDVVTLTHGFDGERFAPIPRAAHDGPLRLGWAGNRRTATKGFDEFVAPLAALPGVELVFCGYADRNRPLEEMPAFYAGIDAYVCTSGSEGNNNSLLEAAGTATAIVTTDVGTVPEYLVDGRSALIVPRERTAFVAAVERLRDDPALRVALGAAAARAVHPAWTWAARAEEHRRFFRDALAGREAARQRMSAAATSVPRAPAPDALHGTLHALQAALGAGRLDEAAATLASLAAAQPDDPRWPALAARVDRARRAA